MGVNISTNGLITHTFLQETTASSLSFGAQGSPLGHSFMERCAEEAASQQLTGEGLISRSRQQSLSWDVLSARCRWVAKVSLMKIHVPLKTTHRFFFGICSDRRVLFVSAAGRALPQRVNDLWETNKCNVL